MGVTLITGHSGAGHITSADAGRLIAGVVGLDRYVLPTGKKFAYTIISNNEIDIADGDLVDQGRHITLPQNDIEVVQIENGTQSKERIDTIAIKYTMDASSGIESASMVLKKGTPVTIGSGTAAPATLTTGNIYAGATEDETALYYVYISGITITKVVQNFKVIEPIDKNTADITALNNSFANDHLRYIFTSNYIIGTGTFFYTVTPPSSGYIPICGTNGDWAANNINKVVQVTRQNGTALVILDSSLASGNGMRVDILWAKQYDS